MGDEPTAMTPAPSEQSVFAEAIRCATPEARAAYLDTACRTDTALRRRVEALLRASENAGDFLEEPPTGLASPEGLVTTQPSEKPGDRIGRYKLLEQIGEGGCGVVYMAEQVEPVRRRVALKVIKLGMDTKQVIARFETERQALALMDHPNIAKVLEAGATDTGRPFFVMELVRGIKITDYCDKNKLATNERLQLFIQVCQAIQHAHQKGIIHRDIKPSNILVTQHDDVAVPKVIDFGIAKATVGQLTDKTVFTAFAQFIGTPAYMSPEQAQLSGLDIDTRADIYSLGVLLYELLTGHTPFDAKELLAAGLDEMRRKIREDEPAKPSTCLSTMQVMDLTTVATRRHVEPPKLIHLVRGDLDWLVMKCLEKDRTRRYETANGLAMDIQRHLSNEPITARPPGRWYEFQKTVRRHKFGFAAAAALIMVLGLGVLASTWQAVRATRAEQEQSRLRGLAEVEAAKSQQVAQFMKGMLQGVGPSAALGRDTTMLREILDQTARRLNELKEQPAVEAELRTTLGNVYADLGEYTNAVAMHREALALWQTLRGNEHLEVATALNGLANVLAKQGRPVEAEAICREALAMRRKLLGNDHLDVAECLSIMAGLFRQQYKFAEAETAGREALAICRKQLGAGDAKVAYAIHPLAWDLNVQGKRTEAEALSREEVAIWRNLFGNDDPKVAWALGDLTVFLRDQGKDTEAETAVREALEIRRKQLAAGQLGLSVELHSLAWALSQLGKQVEAEEIIGEELTMRRRVQGNEHPDVAAALYHLAFLLKAQGKSFEAETAIHEALTIQRKRFGNDPSQVSQSLQLLGDLLSDQRKLPEAEAAIREVLAIRKKLFGEVHQEIERALGDLAQVLQDQRKFAEAEAVWREELAMERRLSGDEHPRVANSLRSLAILLHDSGKTSEAEAMLREALNMLLGNKDPAAASSLAWLGVTLADQGKPAEAEAAYREALALRRKLLGNEHANVVASINHLTAVLWDEGKLAEVEALLREDLVLVRTPQTNTSVPVSARLGLALHHLAEVLRERNALNEARTLAEEAYDLYQQHPDWPAAESQHAVRVFAAVLTDLGDFAGLELLHRKSVEDLRTRLPVDESKLAAALAGLTQTLMAQKQFTEAEPPARECLALREKRLPDDWRTFNARSLLGGSLLGQKKYAEAEPLLLSAFEGIKQREDKIPANGKVRLPESLRRLVQLYEATGQPEKAAEWKAKLAEFDQGGTEPAATVPQP